MTNANADSFFEQVSDALDKRTPQQTLTIDENFTVHIPARVLARYDARGGVQAFWNREYGVFAFFFVKRPDADIRVDDVPEGETWPLTSRDFFAKYANEIDLGKLPARFGFVVEPSINKRSRDEVIFSALQWRQD